MNNPYPTCNCTWWCWDQCPWLWPFGDLSGNAENWAADWQALGNEVGTTPEVGDIACFQPGVDGATAPYGHVAPVTAVFNTSFQIYEMNGTAGPCNTDYRLVAPGSGVSFLKPPKIGAKQMGLGHDPNSGQIYLFNGVQWTYIPSLRMVKFLQDCGIKQEDIYLQEMQESGFPVVGTPA